MLLTCCSLLIVSDNGLLQWPPDDRAYSFSDSYGRLRDSYWFCVIETANHLRIKSTPIVPFPQDFISLSAAENITII